MLIGWRSNLRYADDIALIESSEKDIERLTEYVRGAGENLNVKKTKAHGGMETYQRTLRPTATSTL